MGLAPGPTVCPSPKFHHLAQSYSGLGTNFLFDEGNEAPQVINLGFNPNLVCQVVQLRPWTSV